MRVVVLGGTGNFGARIVRALKDDAGIELLATSRRARSVPGAEAVPIASLDLNAADIEAQLRALSPDVVIHTVGPFQGQDYRVARAALACGAHYLDLADGRSFVAEFPQALDAEARNANRVAVSGVSTLPALSSAVVDALIRDVTTPETIEVAIAPGQCARRGKATLQAVLGYLGKPVRVMEEGQWRLRTGWMDLRRIPLAFGTRWGALCDVPDLTLLPELYPSVRNVRFHAALEIGVQHLVLWCLAGLVRLGLPLPVARWSGALERVAGLFDSLGGAWGGMRVSMVGARADGRRVRKTWLLTVPALSGPQIPCLAAILLVRRMSAGTLLPVGATACMGLLTLADFAPLFAQWEIRTEIRDEQP